LLPFYFLGYYSLAVADRVNQPERDTE